MNFVKVQGAGNDFVLVDAEQAGERDWPLVAREVCHRHFSVGGDGLLVVDRTGGRGRMRMFNPDGTEDMCGNGLRCVAHYIGQAGWEREPEFVVDTLAGPRRVRVTSLDSRRASVTAEMGAAILEPARVPVDFCGDRALDYILKADGRELRASTISTGSTHTVIFHDPTEAEFQALSPRIETHPRFPARTTVLWTTPEGPDRVRVRIWERGVGETGACGTGACAVATVAHLLGKAEAEVTVVSRGGELRVRVADDLRLTLTGPAERVYEGVLPDSASHR